MSLREFIKILNEDGKLIRFRDRVDPYLEMARILNDNRDKAIIFENVKGSNYRTIGGICNSREMFSTALNIKREYLLSRINDAMKNPSQPDIVKKGRCQEIIEKRVNLYDLPIPTFTSRDMGPYITSGVYIADDAEYGYNMSFHRSSPISKDQLVARVCNRDMYQYMKRSKDELDIAICIGLDPSLLLAASISMGIETDELRIANSLKPVGLVKCRSNDVMVPSDAEFVLEGRITKKRADEGPFPDITGTMDKIRKEPIIEIDCITHRKDPIFHVLLPASIEHELLMGMPREPIIFNRVSDVCRCKNVLLSHGGCSWLHGIVQIEKKRANDGERAIKAAFEAHKSMKHLVVVDSDIDIYNPEDVEWAIATRFQGGTNMVIKKDKGSSLDPSAWGDRTTYKVGIDATIPFDRHKEDFVKIKIGE